MNDTIADLRAEYAGLADLARTLTPDQWRLPSKFYGWTPWDEIAHLCFFDETGQVHRWRRRRGDASDSQQVHGHLSQGLLNQFFWTRIP
ncbi:maleylpyruvate isomerase N-terminal domain-containing protein [Variovorax humicola]|uniref:Maleylpyruvate isomerase N-terminal domain-containing protein n=1 Tax=Variovorax humicola TaxID=1769758 RepID=A0ABU8VXN0_9BURK